MAELHVGEGQVYKTLAAAVAAVRSGDVVIVHAGTYREPLKPPAGTTWRAAEGEARPVIDGGWNGKSLGSEKTAGGAVLAINGAGVTVEGLRFINGRGYGAGVTADNTTVRDCQFDNMYSSGIIANGDGPVKNVLIEDCTINRVIMRYAVNGIAGGCAIGLVETVDAVVRGNVISGDWGEGIDIDRGSVNALVERNIVTFKAHMGLYIIRARGTRLLNNVVYHVTEGDDFRAKDDQAPAGIVIGDEMGSGMLKHPHSAGSHIEGNLVVNCGVLFHVRSHDQKTLGYETKLDAATVVRGNTFVAGPATRTGIQIAMQPALPHGAAVFENNLFLMDNAPAGAEIARTQGAVATALVWRNNGWSQLPPPAFRGAGDVIVPAGALADAGAAVTGTWRETNFNIDSYRPRRGGPLDGAEMGALEPLPPTVEAWVMADFGQEPSAGPAPLEVRFTDRSTAGGNATITTWAWEFGDGTTSVEPSPVHIYATPGTYRARLTVTDEGRALSYFVIGPEIVVAEVGPEPPEEPEPPESIWDKLLEVAAALGECLAEMAGERAAAEASLAEAERQLAASAESHDTAAGLLGELLLRLDEYRRGEEEVA